MEPNALRTLERSIRQLTVSLLTGTSTMNDFSKAILILFITSIVVLICVIQYNRRVSRDYLPHNEEDHRIPSIVHFVIGQTDEKNVTHNFHLSTPFTFVNYLNLLAARRHLRPEKLLVHYYEEPDTFWWKMAKTDAEINMTLVASRLVDKIFDYPVYHHAHRSDILRLEKLLESGGIYLDIDVLTLRSFGPLLGLGDVVMAYEDGSHDLIGNSIMLAKRGATFLKRMYDSYQSYDRNCYRCNAIEVTAKLAAIYQKEITVIPAPNFFVPSWSEPKKFFSSNEYNFTLSYASHLWNSFNHARLIALTPDAILQSNFTLARMFCQAIGRNTMIKLKAYFDKTSKS